LLTLVTGQTQYDSVGEYLLLLLLLTYVQALATVNKLSIAAAACGTLGLITAVSAVVAAAIPPAGLLHTGTTLAKLPAFLPAAGLAAACLLAWVGLQRLRQMFFHEGWVLALRK
jgi:hypothetical protein